MNTMLSETLLAPDHALPHRDRLLDEAGVAERIRAASPSDAHALEISRVKAKYRLGESLRVLHKVRAGGKTHFVAARMFSKERARSIYEDACSRAIATEAPLPPVFFDETIDTVFWTFPNDRKIAHLTSLTDSAMAKGIARLAPWASSRVISYAPERAATAQCLSATGRIVAYAKAYASDEGAASLAIHRSLWRTLGFNRALRLPRVYGSAAGRRLLWFAPMPGRSFSEIAPSSLAPVFSALGAALGTFHGLKPPKVAPPFLRLAPSRMANAAALIGRGRPDLAGEASRVATVLERSFPASNVDVSLVHGDINFRNWLIDADRVSLIDLDQVGVGSAAIDLGGAIAGLRYRTIIGLWSPEMESTLRQALLRGYARVRDLPAKEVLSWHCGAALFVERALRAVSRFRVEGLTHLPKIVTESLALSQETLQ